MKAFRQRANPVPGQLQYPGHATDYLDRISSQKRKILDLVEQGTTLQNEIQFQQSLHSKNGRVTLTQVGLSQLRLI